MCPSTHSPTAARRHRREPVKLPQLDRIIAQLQRLRCIHWAAPIFILLERFAGLEELIDQDADFPEASIVQVLEQFSTGMPITTDNEIADALSQLNCFTYRVKSPVALWNPLEQSYVLFCAEAKDHVVVYQIDTEHPAPATIRKWLIDCIQNRGA